MYELTIDQISMISGGDEALNAAAAAAGEAHGRAVMQVTKAAITSGAAVSLTVTVVGGLIFLLS